MTVLDDDLRTLSREAFVYLCPASRMWHKLARLNWHGEGG